MSDKRREGDGSGRARKRKMKVMDESEQTLAERRELRAEQMQLKMKVIERQEDIADLTKSAMWEMTEANQKLFRSVNYTREAVGDGQTMKLIAEAASKQVKQVSKASSGVELEPFLHKFCTVFTDESEGNGPQFNWTKLGEKVSLVFLSTPRGGDFMMGPLDKPARGPRTHNRREIQNDNNVPSTAPEVVAAPTKGKKGKTTKDQTGRRITKMRVEASKKLPAGQEKDMFEALLNPRSFTQSVENLFDFSFFVKNGEGAVSLDETTRLPKASFPGIQSGAGDSVEAPQQWLMSFSPADFRQLKELYNLQESTIPHRDEGPTSDYFDPLIDRNRDTSDRQ